MILAGHCMERYSSLGQYRAGAHLVVIPERGVVFPDYILTKAGPLFDARDATDDSRCGAYGSSYHGPDGTCCSVACGRSAPAIRER
jgi:hypothetical protein